MIGPLRAVFHDRLGRRAEQLARRIAPHLPAGARLLDIGSGTGHNARALRLRTGGSCIEADVVDFHVVGDGPMLFDGERLPLPDNAVDVSLVVHALSYTEDPAALLREAGRVASRGVVVIQSTYQGAWGRAFLLVRGRIQGRLSFRVCRALGLIPPVADPLGTRHLFSRSRLEATVTRSGLVVQLWDSEPSSLSRTSRDLLVLDHSPT